MNPQSNQTNRQKIREAIFNDVNSVWQIVESLEKKSIKSFGEHDPMTKTLGFACVHMMNTSSEIEERVSESINKLKPESVDQLLEILSIIRWSGPENRYEINNSFQTAVKNVRTKYKKRRNTMADLCVRRLGFTGDGATDGFISLVEDWLLKDGSALKRHIKKHTHDHQHKKIDNFFESGGIVR